MSNEITLHTATLDGKQIAYSSETVFTVDIGKGTKGSYRTQYTFTGKLGQALFYYQSINIGNGYKKRLTMAGKVLAKLSSANGW